MKPVYSIFFHNYYGSHQSWINYFEKNTAVAANLYYNTTEDSLYNVADNTPDLYTRSPRPQGNLREIIMRQSPNKGKDIGGKLVLLDACCKLASPTEYGLFLHDKKSPQKANNETWSHNLLRIAESSFANSALKIFAGKPDTGIISAAGNVQDEYDYTANEFRSNNKTLLPGLQDMFQVYPPAYQYVTGTMFWFRMQPLLDFFYKHPPLKIRQLLEKGNVTDEHTGSNTHSWERLLCWIITAQQYTIKTI